MRVFFNINGVAHKTPFDIEVIPNQGDLVDVLDIVGHKFFTDLGCTDVDKCRNYGLVKQRWLLKDKKGLYWEVIVTIDVPHPLNF